MLRVRLLPEDEPVVEKPPSVERTAAGLQYVFPGTEKPAPAPAPRIAYPRDGDQLVIPGAERISGQALMTRIAEQPLRPRVGSAASLAQACSVVPVSVESVRQFREHSSIACDVDRAVAVGRVVREARQLHVQHAQYDLLRRDLRAQRRRPAPRDLGKQRACRAVLPAALGDDACGLGEEVGSGHAPAPTRRGPRASPKGDSCGYCGYLRVLFCPNARKCQCIFICGG